LSVNDNVLNKRANVTHQVQLKSATQLRKLYFAVFFRSDEAQLLSNYGIRVFN